jgi:hypothetical protein
MHAEGAGDRSPAPSALVIPAKRYRFSEMTHVVLTTGITSLPLW